MKCFICGSEDNLGFGLYAPFEEDGGEMALFLCEQCVPVFQAAWNWDAFWSLGDERAISLSRESQEYFRQIVSTTENLSERFEIPFDKNLDWADYARVVS